MQTPSPDPLLSDARALRAAYSRPSDQWPAFVVDASVADQVVELGPVPEPVFPAENPYSKNKADLGEVLFYDPRLSATNQMACASCHDPDLGWADGRSVSFGVNRKELARNAPPAQHSGHLTKLFWDGRASTLEDLTLKVIENRDEMHGFGEKVAAKLNRVEPYRSLFAEAFQDEPDVSATAEQPVTIGRVQKAVATFVRTLNGQGSRFDSFVKGRHDVLSDQELRGLHLYRTQAGCMNCHHGPVMSDSALHVTGLHLYQRADEDLGAFRITGNDSDRGAFKTPPLRNIARTAPYMHHGLFHTLDNVVSIYNGGVPTGKPRGKQLDDPHYPKQTHLVHPLGLTKQDILDVVAFMETLSEPQRRVPPPELPEFPPNQ